MDKFSDRQRAEAALSRTLKCPERFVPGEEDCANTQLWRTLQRIRQRKEIQRARLLRWLGRSGSEFREHSPVPTPGPASSGAVEKTSFPRSSEGKGGPGTVLERRQITPDLIVLKLARPESFRFEPGQSTKLGLDGLKRRFSLVSAPHEPFLEFFIELVPGGRMSQRLKPIREGHVFTVDPPRGRFLLDRGFTNHLMVATVTGVSPFVSMLRHQFHSGAGGNRYFLLHGASYRNEFTYQAELEQLAAANSGQLRYWPTVSRPDEAPNRGWSGATGRVETLVEKVIQDNELDPAATCVYACGHPGMVDSVQTICGDRGYAVKVERYN